MSSCQDRAGAAGCHQRGAPPRLTGADLVEQRRVALIEVVLHQEEVLGLGGTRRARWRHGGLDGGLAAGQAVQKRPTAVDPAHS